MNPKPSYSDVRFDKSPWGILELHLIQEGGILRDVTITSINPSGALFFGMSQQAMMGQSVNGLFPHLMDQFYDWKQFLMSLPSDGSLRETQQYVPLFNRHLWVNAFSLDPESVMVYFQDVTQSVNDQADRLAIITALRDLVFELDEAGRFIGVYTSEPDYLFTPRQRLMGRRIDEIYADPFLSQFKGLMDAARNLGGRREMTYPSIIENDPRWYTAECRYLSRPNGGIYLVGIKDITREHDLESQVARQQEFFELVARGSNDGIFDWDLVNNTLYLSPRWKATLGYADDDLQNIQTTFEQLLHPQDIENVLSYNRTFLASSATEYALEFRMMHRDGHIVWIRSRGSAQRDASGKALRLTGSHTDITIERLAQESLKASEAKYRLITENISDVIWVVAVDPFRIVYVSPSMAKLRGIQPQEILAMPFKDVLETMGFNRLIDQLNRDVVLMKAYPTQPIYRVFEVDTQHQDGHPMTLEVNTTMHTTDDGSIEVIGLARDITHRKQIEAELSYLSFHDQLTGLYNRAYYETEKNRLDVERNLPLSLILCDVNGLKITNDAFGHQAGDELLVEFGNLLKNTLRSDDIIARTGGDEFMVLLPKTDADQVKMLVQRLREAMEAYKPVRFKLSAAMGCATKTEISMPITEVYKAAEDHMYTQKVADRQDFNSNLLHLMLSSLFEKHPNEKDHSEAVRRLSKMIGDVMDLEDQALEELEQAALLHDIGKIGLDEQLVKDPYHLTSAEFEQFKRHPEIGYQVLRSAYEYSHIADIVLYHHESVNGTGFPKGLKGEEIPLASRIIHVANDYHVLIQAQHHSTAEAVSILRERKGTDLDPAIVDVFIEQVLNYR